MITKKHLIQEIAELREQLETINETLIFKGGYWPSGLPREFDLGKVVKAIIEFLEVDLEEIPEQKEKIILKRKGEK